MRSDSYAKAAKQKQETEYKTRKKTKEKAVSIKFNAGRIAKMVMNCCKYQAGQNDGGELRFGFRQIKLAHIDQPVQQQQSKNNFFINAGSDVCNSRRPTGNRVQSRSLRNGSVRSVIGGKHLVQSISGEKQNRPQTK